MRRNGTGAVAERYQVKKSANRMRVSTLVRETKEIELTSPRAKLIQGDVREVLKTLPNGVARCCVTSPPYWGKRDYGVPGQIGAEMNIEDYLDELKMIFNEVKRVLTDDGTLWLNIGDCYTSGDRAWRDPDKKNPNRFMSYRPPTPNGLKPKDLIGVPWRLAFALQAAGWHLRSDIVWYKPNCQPESVKDRPTLSHEYMFLFSKSERYYYDYEAVTEPALINGGKRNRRTVWSINTEPCPGAHIATFPTGLVEPCIKAGSREGDVVLDPFMGSGTVGVVCKKHGRDFIGVELHPKYVALAESRISEGR
jgi:site-specific DNA-methyltransferase (cytosine-N4-specific)